MPAHTPSKVHDAATAAVLVVRLEESDALPNESKGAAIGLSVSLGKLRRRLLGDE